MPISHSKVHNSSCTARFWVSVLHQSGALTSGMARRVPASRSHPPRQACAALFASDDRGAVSTANVPTMSDLAPLLVLVSRSLGGLGTNGRSRIVTRPQAELLLHSLIPEFPGPNTRQRKGSSICALPNTRRCKPRWQLPLCSTFSLFFSRCREPSSVSDAECVFAVYVQRDRSSYFRTGTGMEEQSFVLIANLNTFFFSSSISRSTFEYETRTRHVSLPVYFDTGAAPCFGLARPVSAQASLGSSPSHPGGRQRVCCCRHLCLPSPARAAGGDVVEPPGCGWSRASAQHRTSGWPGHAKAQSNYSANSHRVANRAQCHAGCFASFSHLPEKC